MANNTNNRTPETPETPEEAMANNTNNRTPETPETPEEAALAQLRAEAATYGREAATAARSFAADKRARMEFAAASGSKDGRKEAEKRLRKAYQALVSIQDMEIQGL